MINCSRYFLFEASFLTEPNHSHQKFPVTMVWYIKSWTCLFMYFVVNCPFFQITPTRYAIYGRKLACFITSAILLETLFSGAQLGGSGEASPVHFWKLKKVPKFWKKVSDCVHPWVKFSIQNVVLRVCRRENWKNLPLRAFYSCFFCEMFFEVPWFH